MWQVVSGIASLLSDCGLQAVVQTVAGDGKPYLLHTGRAFMLLGAPSSAGDTHPLIILLGLLSLRFNLRMISFWLVSRFSGQPGGLRTIVFSR
jgi:hypothetical protein